MKKLVTLILLASTACTTVGPNYQAASPSRIGVPAAYNSNGGSGATQTPTTQELASWWTQFNDPLLNELVGRALGANLDLASGRARLRQARESVRQSQADRLPTVGASGTVNRSGDTDGNSQTSYSLSTDASWEADLFGGVSRSIEASTGDAQASEFDLAAIQVSLAGEIATNYVQARLAQQREKLARDNLKIAEDNLQIAQWRLQAGLVSSIDVEQARSQRAQISASIPSYEQNFSNAAYRLGVLTGQAPAAMVSRLEQDAALPQAPASIAVGIPGDTLRQRPDVRSAERSLAAQTARIGVAEAALYPSLRIGGNIGTSALSIGGLVDLITGNLFATLSQTLFDGGRNRSQVRSQQAATDAAFANYKKSVLTALEDVENGLVARRTAEQRQASFQEAFDAANNQAILARSQYRAGLSDFLTLLEAERTLVSARDNLLTNQADQTLAVIELYRALGGGWDPSAASSRIES